MNKRQIWKPEYQIQFEDHSQHTATYQIFWCEVNEAFLPERIDRMIFHRFHVDGKNDVILHEFDYQIVDDWRKNERSLMKKTTAQTFHEYIQEKREYRPKLTLLTIRLMML